MPSKEGRLLIPIHFNIYYDDFNILYNLLKYGFYTLGRTTSFFYSVNKSLALITILFKMLLPFYLCLSQLFNAFYTLLCTRVNLISVYLTLVMGSIIGFALIVCVLFMILVGFYEWLFKGGVSNDFIYNVLCYALFGVV